MGYSPASLGTDRLGSALLCDCVRGEKNCAVFAVSFFSGNFIFQSWVFKAVDMVNIDPLVLLPMKGQCHMVLLRKCIEFNLGQLNSG